MPETYSKGILALGENAYNEGKDCKNNDLGEAQAYAECYQFLCRTDVTAELEISDFAGRDSCYLIAQFFKGYEGKGTKKLYSNTVEVRRGK